MPRTRVRPPWLIVACLVPFGCGADTEFSPDDPTQCAPVIVDVESSCAEFCATAVGECEAFTFDEESCRRGCETNLSEAYGCSEGCGTALEAMFRCVGERDDCQDVFDWRDRVDDHPCTDAVDDVALVCPF